MGEIIAAASTSAGVLTYDAVDCFAFVRLRGELSRIVVDCSDYSGVVM